MLKFKYILNIGRQYLTNRPIKNNYKDGEEKVSLIQIV